MTTRLKPGQKRWNMERDAEGHRFYHITYHVEADVTDGPANVLLTPGLPTPGAYWNVDGDVDLGAYFNLESEVKPLVDNEPNTEWEVTLVFTSKPLKRCYDTQFDPLTEPMILSGSFSNHHKEITTDRFGKPILTSSHEQIRGPQVEFEVSYPIVKIKQNVLALQLSLLKAVIDKVNDAPLWGMLKGEIRLNSVSWEQKFYGTCLVFFERTFEFHIKDGGHDRDILDEGSKVLNGHWHPTNGEWVLDNINGKVPDHNNPTHFIDFPDRQNNPIRGVLDGKGKPAKVITQMRVGQGTQQYVSITDGNIGNPLEDGTKWVPIETPGDELQEWEEAVYSRGVIVHVTSDIPAQAGTYVATDETINMDLPNLDPDFWVKLPTGISDEGDYSNAVTYDKGEYVTDAAATAAAEGKIHVEYYGEANFLLLGIPTTIG